MPRGAAAGLLSWRNRLLSSARFQRWVARTPLLRLVGRRRARALFDLCAGFIHSQVLYAGVRSGAIEALRDGPLRSAQLRARTGFSAQGFELWLDAARGLGLVESRRGEVHALGPLGAALAGNPAVLTMIEHQALFYADLHDPLALLRGTAPAGRLAAYWAYARNDAAAALPAAAVADYSALMSATQPLVAGELLDAYPFRRHRVLLDVGGGEGAFLCAAAGAAPQLQLMLFDLPEVAARARQRLAEAGLAGRSRVIGGDFRTDRLPAGADLVTLVRVVHDHDDESALRLLRAVHVALPAGGRVVIAEPMRAVPGSLAAADAYLGFYLLAMRQGRVRSVEELSALLAAAGFRACHRHHTPRPWQCAVVSAAATGVNRT
ncbi:MAG TPA: methyltransferase [Steroidobacteraceae bacterium]|nr:methyltransferase [Steroidobacteraceae bacterium]